MFVIDIPSSKRGISIGGQVYNNPTGLRRVFFQGANSSIATDSDFYFDFGIARLNVPEMISTIIFPSIISYQGEHYLDMLNQAFYSFSASVQESILFFTRRLMYGNSSISVNYDDRDIFDPDGFLSIDYHHRYFYAGEGFTGTQIGWNLPGLIELISVEDTTSGGSVGTLLNNPNAGDPTGYWTVIINSQTGYIPFWK